MDHVAAALACSGATALAIDAPNAGRGDRFVRFTEEDFDEQVYLIQNLRHSADWLVEEQGHDRLGFVGVSYGAAMGSLLVGVEPRIDAAALMVGDGGLVAHFTEGGKPSPEVADTPGIEEWIELMTPIEPSLFMADAGDTPIRLVSARDDEFIPEGDAIAWHESAGEGAEAVWVDTGHFMSAQVWTETVLWLSEHLSLDRQRIPSCADQFR
jgi:pimeloyl-ACP methyl ester carboxylesterase